MISASNMEFLYKLLKIFITSLEATLGVYLRLAPAGPGWAFRPSGFSLQPPLYIGFIRI